MTGRTCDDIIPPLEEPNGDILVYDYAKATLLKDFFASQSAVNLHTRTRYY